MKLWLLGNIERFYEELGRRTDKKGDFGDAGLYNAWMVLYRYRRKIKGLKKYYPIEKEYIFELTKYAPKSILTDMISTNQTWSCGESFLSLL